MYSSFSCSVILPRVTSEPVGLTNSEPGSDACFHVKATGTEPLSYQWQKDGVNLTDGGRIKGATTAKLSITAVQKSDEGGYTCVVSNTAGTVTSKPATLTLSLGECCIISLQPYGTAYNTHLQIQWPGLNLHPAKGQSSKVVTLLKS